LSDGWLPFLHHIPAVDFFKKPITSKETREREKELNKRKTKIAQ
jgi:hypothetical protein